MVRIIPRDLIKHLEWTTNQEPQEPTTTTRSTHPSIDDIINTRKFSKGVDCGKIYDSLRNALKFAGSSGIVLTMPELIAAKAKTTRTTLFWKDDNLAVHTEENIGIDKRGKYYAPGEPVLVVVHGGGILTPDRLQKAHDEGKTIDGSVSYETKEFEDLLLGWTPEGHIPMYTLDDLQREQHSELLPHQFSRIRRFGVVMPYKLARATRSGYHKKFKFWTNPLVQARCAGISLDTLELYHWKAQSKDADVANSHHYKGRDATIPQGRMLYLERDFLGPTSTYNNFIRWSCFLTVKPKNQKDK